MQKVFINLQPNVNNNTIVLEFVLVANKPYMYNNIKIVRLPVCPINKRMNILRNSSDTLIRYIFNNPDCYDVDIQYHEPKSGEASELMKLSCDKLIADIDFWFKSAKLTPIEREGVLFLVLNSNTFDILKQKFEDSVFVESNQMIFLTGKKISESNLPKDTKIYDDDVDYLKVMNRESEDNTVSIHYDVYLGYSNLIAGGYFIIIIKSVGVELTDMNGKTYDQPVMSVVKYYYRLTGTPDNEYLLPVTEEYVDNYDPIMDSNETKYRKIIRDTIIKSEIAGFPIDKMDISNDISSELVNDYVSDLIISEEG